MCEVYVNLPGQPFSQEVEKTNCFVNVCCTQHRCVSLWKKIFFVWALSMYWCFKMSWTNVVRHNICIAAPTSCQSFLHGSLSWYNEQKWTLFATEITNNSKTWLYNFIICVPLCVCIWSHERNWNFFNFFSQSYIFNLKNFVTELIHSSVFESFSLT